MDVGGREKRLLSLHIFYEISTAMFTLKVLGNDVVMIEQMSAAREARPDLAVVEVCFEWFTH